MGPVALDEDVFQNQRLGLGVGNDVLEVGKFADHTPGFPVEAGRRAEVGSQSIAQHRRLANVDYRAAGILHQVNAGSVGRHQHAMVKFMANHR